MAKKKLKLKKYPNGGKAPIFTKDKNDPRIQAYQDSLDLFNYTNFQKQIEPSYSQLQGLSTQLGFNKGSEYLKNQQKLLNYADSIVKSNPNIEFGSYGDAVQDIYSATHKGKNRGYYINPNGTPSSPDIRSVSDKIHPNDFWTGTAGNHSYIKPVQPIVYQPEERRARITIPNVNGMNATKTGSNEVTFNNTVTRQDNRLNPVSNSSLSVNLNSLPSLSSITSLPPDPWTVNPSRYRVVSDYVTSDGHHPTYEKIINKPISLEGLHKEGLLQSNNNLGEINSIPFTPGSYFTRDRLNQELESKQFGRQGKKDYFDKKSGKLLGTYKNGGFIKKYGNAGEVKFTNPSQDNRYSKVDNTRIDNFKQVEPNQESFSFKTKQIRPNVATGQVEESISPLDLIGTGVFKGLAKGAVNTGEKAIMNTYRLNPSAFKPTEGMMYRGIGEEGMKDALKSGVFRANQNIEPIMHGNFNMAKSFDGVYYSPKFDIANTYGKGYIAEVPESSAEFLNRYARGKDWSKVTKTQIPISDGKILKKDWLKGYKEIPQPEIKPKLNLKEREITNETKPYNTTNKSNLPENFGQPKQTYQQYLNDQYNAKVKNQIIKNAEASKIKPELKFKNIDELEESLKNLKKKKLGGKIKSDWEIID